MEIEFINNHIILSIVTEQGIKKAILDTGNPSASVFSDDSLEKISICDVELTLKDDFITNQIRKTLNWNDISELVNTEIDGIIGYDFFKSNDIIIDLKEFNLSIVENKVNFDLFPITFFMNIPIIDIKIQGQGFKAIFDTGAMYSIINENHHHLLSDKNEIIDEYSPMMGKFKANLYGGDITIGNNTINDCMIACAPQYNKVMNMLPKVESILGMETLNGKEIYLSYKKQKMGLK